MPESQSSTKSMSIRPSPELQSGEALAPTAQDPRRKKARSPLREPGSLFSSARLLFGRGRGDTGNVLLSHNLASHYHWGCSVSLPCSEWERVGPLRYDHQRAEPSGRIAASAARPARGRVSDD